MKLTILGCTGSMSGPHSAASSYLVQADDGARTWSLLFDIGPGSFGTLMAHHDPSDVDAVFLSHLHADHMSDMISYYVYRRWHPNGTLGPVDVLAPSAALARVRGVAGESDDETYGTEFAFTPLSDEHSVQVGPFEVTSYAVEHPVEAYAFRIEGPSASGGRAVITYSGDTDACEGLAKASRGADLFLSEAAFVEGRDETRGIHMTGERVGEVSTQSGVRSLVLTHIQPWTDPVIAVSGARAHYSGPIDLATTGRVFEV